MIKRRKSVDFLQFGSEYLQQSEYFYSQTFVDSSDLPVRVDTCDSAATDSYVGRCSVPENVTCLGPRQFYRKIKCSFTSTYSWRTTLVLSVLFGGFGADRFYLGHVGMGILKLGTFGGLGLWTVIDAILVYAGYVTPWDGSNFVDLDNHISWFRYVFPPSDEL